MAELLIRTLQTFLDLFSDQKELAKDILFKPVQLIELNKIPDEELKERLWYGIMSFVMKNLVVRKAKYCLIELLSLLQELEKHNANSYLHEFFTYVFSASRDEDPDELIDIMKNGLSQNVIGEAMSIAEILEKRGVEKGIIIGIEKGELEKAKKIAIKLLKLGVKDKLIIDATNLSAEELKKIKDLIETTH